MITLIASFAKIVPASLVAKYVTGRSNRYCITVGILMNTRGLVELIALNIALEYVCSHLQTSTSPLIALRTS